MSARKTKFNYRTTILQKMFKRRNHNDKNYKNVNKKFA